MMPSLAYVQKSSKEKFILISMSVSEKKKGVLSFFHVARYLSISSTIGTLILSASLTIWPSREAGSWNLLPLSCFEKKS